MPCESAQVVERLGQLVERVVVVERARARTGCCSASRRQTSSLHCGAGVLLGRLAGQRREVAVAPVAAGEAEQHEVGRQQTRGWPGRRPPAISFLRARSPVTPKTTSAHGSGTRGSRRSRGSRSGLARSVTVPGGDAAGTGTAAVLGGGPSLYRRGRDGGTWFGHRYPQSVASVATASRRFLVTGRAASS